MLTVEDRTDLKGAARLGLITETFLAQILGRDRIARGEASALREKAAEERKRETTTEDLRFMVAVARRELEVARQRGHEPSIHDAERILAHFERRLAESLAKRAAPIRERTNGESRGESRRIELPAGAAEPLSVLRELRRLARDLGAVAISSSVSPGSPIRELDAQLCLAWNNDSPLGGAGRASAVTRLRGMKPYEAGRLISARNAEKAALRYYERLGLEVEDVSLTQLEPGASSWKDFDIRAGDRCIDVKNARESLNGEGRYVEHCVPSFKLSRQTGDHVRVAGVVSPYLAETGAYFGWPQGATMLGEVDASEVRALIEWARARFGGRLELRDPSRAGFLPGWLFEFPPIHYPARESAIAAAPGMLRKLLDSLAYSCEIPGWLWIFSDEPIPDALPTAAVLRELRGLRRSIGISRRSLYALALGLALEAAGGAADGDSQLRALRDACRVSATTDRDDGGVQPLGLDDPLRYVDSLITTLLEIVSTLRRREIDVVSFRLAHPSILEGALGDGKRMTLFAYCGGWQRHPFMARCGKSPLSIAWHATCSSCGRLICDNCGHCSTDCEQREPRQHEVARAAEATAEKARVGQSPDDDWDCSF